jgi:hypothetical protein
MNASVDGEFDRSGPAEDRSSAHHDDAENTATPALQSSHCGSPVSRADGGDDSTGEVERGLVLRARYVLEEVIGRGGTSLVFRARDLHRTSTEDGSQRRIALKLLRAEWRSDPRAIERLRREFRQMQSLSHAGIVRVFDLDCDGGVWFMTMELVEGRTAKAWMQEPYDQADALRVIAACCQALEHAHGFGFLHGDLKPTNVLVADDGTVKLIDFGAAPSPGARLAAQANAMLATTALYASPQVLSGKAVELSDDVFSLACLSYGILSAGKHPFGRRPSLEDGRAKSSPTRASAIPSALFAVIERALSADRHERPPSVSAFLGELTEAAARLRPETLTAQPNEQLEEYAVRQPLLLEAAERHRGRHGPWPAVTLALLLLAILATAIMVQSDRREPGKARVAGGTAVAAGTAVGATPPESAGSGTSAPPHALIAADASSGPLTPATDTAVRPSASGVISFEEAAVHASAMQPLVAISVKRERGSRGAAAFIWRVEGGTAYPGVDFQRLQPQLVHFLDGQTVRTLYIPLISTRAGQSLYQPRSFTVALQPVAGGLALGRIDRVTVTIDPAASSTHAAMYQARADQ